MKFKMWAEFTKISNETWNVGIMIHDAIIYDEKFFIYNYPIHSWEEDGKTWHRQIFVFNPKLYTEIRQFLFPGTTVKYNTLMSQDKAWDFHHYLYFEGFRDSVHPVSRSGDFLRDIFEGTQEEIYEVCKRVHDKWIKPRLK